MAPYIRFESDLAADMVWYSIVAEAPNTSQVEVRNTGGRRHGPTISTCPIARPIHLKKNGSCTRSRAQSTARLRPSHLHERS